MIKAFNSITAYSLANNAMPQRTEERIALPIAGSNQRAKQVTIDLLKSIGFDPYDAGTLSESWRYQPGTSAYCSDPNLRQLPKLLQRAERAKAPVNRDKAAKMMAKIPNFPPSELVRLARLSAGLDTFNPRTWLAALHLAIAMLES